MSNTNNNVGAKPDIFITGVMKGGTTILHDYICTHPQIAAGKQKEIHYFSLFYAKGTQWYENHFSDIPDNCRAIDASPTYFDTTNTAQIPRLMRAYTEDPRVIVITRDPVIRAISQFIHLKVTTAAPALKDVDIDEFFAQDIAEAYRQSTTLGYYLNLVLGFSLYTRKYLTYRQEFEKHQLLVLDNDALRKKPTDVMENVFSFLNVDYVDSKMFGVEKHSNGSALNKISLESYNKLAEFLYPDYKRFASKQEFLTKRLYMMTSEKHASASAAVSDGVGQSAENKQLSVNNATASGNALLDGHKQVRDASSESADNARPNLTVVENNDVPVVEAENLVHEGRDGWLFLVAGSNHVLNMYQHKSSFTPVMAKSWVKLLQQRSNRFASKGIQYLHLPAPEKLTVLHKFYRGEIEKIEGSPIHQLADNHAAEIPCLVNVLPLFAKQVDKTLLYWKTDTHWSFWGCFSAYQLLCARMGVEPKIELLKYPYSEGPVLFDLGAKLDEPTKETGRFYQLTKNAQRSYANTMVRFKEEQGLINEANLHVGSSVVYRNSSENAIDKCVMLFGDSFSEYREHLLTGMLAETFREVHFIWNASIDHNYVDRVKPDIVITELAERFMTRVPDDKFDVQEFAAERLKAFAPETKSSEQATPFAVPKSVIREAVIMPSETYHLHPPKRVQKECRNIGNDKVIKTNPVRLSDTANAKVFFTGDKLLVRAQGGEAVKRYGVSENEFKALPWKEHRRLHGTTMLLGDSAGAHCYYHWMLDLLPKLGVLEKAGIKLSSVDHFLVREMNGSFHKQTLERLGIDASRVVQTKNDSHLECDRLLMVKCENGINMKMNRFIPNWMKHLYPPTYPIGDRIKLYISRPTGVRRGVANEAKMLPILRKAGYTIESMEGMTVLEQAQLLARADVLISPHGGALTNMIFCRPGIKVVELFGRHVYPFYYGLAQMCGHEYHAILENSEDYPRLIQYAAASKVGSAQIQKQTRTNSFDVDLNVLKATLDALEA